MAEAGRMPDDAQADLRQTLVELRRQLEERTAERDEALAREAALGEVLQVINASPGNLAPVFDAVSRFPSTDGVSAAQR
jgi:hypothetical protein